MRSYGAIISLAISIVTVGACAAVPDLTFGPGVDAGRGSSIDANVADTSMSMPDTSTTIDANSSDDASIDANVSQMIDANASADANMPLDASDPVDANEPVDANGPKCGTEGESPDPGSYICCYERWFQGDDCHKWACGFNCGSNEYCCSNGTCLTTPCQ